jgi:hypothetical protein
MRKATRNEMRGMGWLTAGSLALALAAFGCSSNQYAGNGQPTSVTPTINSVNHSGTMGTSSGTEGMPPMSSSYSNPATPRVDVDALAKLAAQRGFRGVVLGPSDPGGIQQGVTVASGQFASPANAVLPQSTVNSSINSQPTPVITGGDIGLVASANPATAGGASVTGVGTVVDTTGATIGTTAATTAAPTASAATSALTSSTGAPTVAASAAFSPALMNSTPAPQATGSTGPTLRTVVATAGRNTVVTGTTATTARTTTAATSAARTTTATTNVNVVSGIQLQTGANGAIMMTNVATTAPAGKGK